MQGNLKKKKPANQWLCRFTL